MSELQQEVSRRKRRFGEEFKRDAVRLVVEEGYTFKMSGARLRVFRPTARTRCGLVPRS